MRFLSFHGSNANTEDQLSPPVFLRIRSSTTFIQLTVSAAIFTDVFLYGVIIPVIPFALRSRVHIAEGSVQHWVSVLLAVYSGGLLIMSPLMGWYADYVKTRRSVFLAGLLLLLGATLMLCLGKSIAVLVIGRLLQGTSASIVWVAGLALLVDTVGQEKIGQNMGILILAMTGGALIAPLLGGIVYDAGGYYSVFAMAFGVIAIDIALRLTFIEKRVLLSPISSLTTATDRSTRLPFATCLQNPIEQVMNLNVRRVFMMIVIPKMRLDEGLSNSSSHLFFILPLHDG